MKEIDRSLVGLTKCKECGKIQDPPIWRQCPRCDGELVEIPEPWLLKVDGGRLRGKRCLISVFA